MGYIHVEVETGQSPKHAGSPCGDVLTLERTARATTILLCDGIGSGVKANLAAQLCASWLGELLRGGFSLRQAFGSVVRQMNDVRQTQTVYPYAAFAVAQILGDGLATILTYESPPPVFISAGRATPLPQRTVTIERAMIGETTCLVEPGEGLLLVSDGITQAGLGGGLPHGWGVEGVYHHATEFLGRGGRLADLADSVHRKARGLWGGAAGDDCTVALAFCRQGKIVNILTGPPSNPALDHPTVRAFLAGEGAHVVCGATTASVVAAALGQKVGVEQNARSLLAPPRYAIGGVDLVTEGAVTLNQVFNVLEEDPANFEEVSGVTELCALLRDADRVNFTVGLAANPANSSISFRQRGIISRRNIIPLIADKLRAAGKLVVVKYL